jgi:hypothetical protein
LNTLASLLGWVVSQLQAWTYVTKVQTLETESFDEHQFHFKVRAQLTPPFILQIRFYYNQGYLDYAYQLFNDGPLLRWDNKEDATDLPTAPHHFHNEQSEIVESPLNGDPVRDGPIVREAVEHFLSKPLSSNP